MKKYSYHRVAYDHYKRRLRNGGIYVYGSLFFWFVFVYLNLQASLPSVNDFLEGRLNSDERLGLLLTLFSLTVLAVGAMEVRFGTIGTKQIEMSELDVLKNYLLITYPSFKNGSKFPEKSFLQLSYDQIKKIDWVETYTKGQKSNFTIYHKSGCVELCIENPEEAAYMIDENIGRVKALKNCPDSASEQTQRPKKAACRTVAVCPYCQAEFEIFPEQQNAICPSCSKEVEL